MIHIGGRGGQKSPKNHPHGLWMFPNTQEILLLNVVSDRYYVITSYDSRKYSTATKLAPDLSISI